MFGIEFFGFLFLIILVGWFSMCMRFFYYKSNAIFIFLKWNACACKPFIFWNAPWFLMFCNVLFKYSRQNQEGLYIEIIILMNKNYVVLVLMFFFKNFCLQSKWRLSLRKFNKIWKYEIHIFNYSSIFCTTQKKKPNIKI